MSVVTPEIINVAALLRNSNSIRPRNAKVLRATKTATQIATVRA
jgi:hypothetical protein